MFNIHMQDHKLRQAELIQEAEKVLYESGIKIYACLIEGENKPSMRLFEKSGYKEFKDIKYYTKKINPNI